MRVAVRESMMATGTKADSLMHKRSKRKRYCRRRKCALRIPLIGVCLWSTTVRKKCARKKRR